MLHRSIQTVFKIALLFTLGAASLNAIEMPIRKNITIEVAKKEFNIIKFPFKVTKIQLGVFSYRKLKSNKKPPPTAQVTKKITLSKKKAGASHTKVSPKLNILNIKKVDNIITMRPAAKGEVELIVWGNKSYPMVIKIKVVDEADQNIEFIHIVDERKQVIEFESSPHEKVIEKLMRTLFNENVNPAPRGYEHSARREIYDVGVENDDGFVYVRVKVSLTKEIIGKKYVGQVWNVNLVPEFEEDNETVFTPDDMKLTLFYEMFDSPGVYAISLETYSITKEHGTRLMIVRSKEN